MTAEEPTAEEAGGSGASWLDLYDYRLRVATMYRDRNAAWQAGEDAEAVCSRFRRQKDALFAGHPQSPLDAEARQSFAGLHYFPYDASFCVNAILTPVFEESADAAHETAIPHRRAAFVDFEISGTPLRLSVYWLDVYGGGLFLPFRDDTCPSQSYGAGRYLFDTVKGSDFIRLEDASTVSDSGGYAGGTVLLDFNYAYNPSCAYDVRWVCPLAPRENWISTSMRAGEKKYVESA
jgi:uncharacterized protein (DUF1684 family)